MRGLVVGFLVDAAKAAGGEIYKWGRWQLSERRRRAADIVERRNFWTVYQALEREIGAEAAGAWASKFWRGHGRS